MIQAVLFDKDGTLIDFHGTWIPAFRAAAAWIAEETGRPELAHSLLVAAGYDPRSGTAPGGSVLAAGSNRELTDLWRRDPDVDAVPDLHRRTELLLLEYVAARPAPAAQLLPLFDGLRAAGLRLGIATMDSTESAQATARGLGIADHLDFVTGYDGGHGAKPSPGMVTGFCAAVGVPASAVAVVGDTLHDMHMARAAGAGLAIGVLTGAGSRAHLEGDADHVIDSVAALPDVLSPVSG